MQASRCPGRERELAALSTFLEGGRVCAITGIPGSGRSTLAAALCASLEGPGIAVSLAGCETRADVVRAVGDAMGVFPCGDEALVVASVAGRWLCCDDVGFEASEALLGLSLDATLIVVGDVQSPVPSVELGPMSDGSLPLLKAVSDGLGVAVSSLPQRLAHLVGLAGLPMGLGVRVEVVEGALVLAPDPRERRILRAGLAHILGSERAEGVCFVREVLRRRPGRYDALVATAHGAAPIGVPDPRDVLLLRAVGDGAYDEVAIIARVAAARLLVRCGQYGEAQRLLERAVPATPALGGLVGWVLGDIRLICDDLGAAELGWKRARLSLGPDALAELGLASAETLALRGHRARAAVMLGSLRGAVPEACLEHVETLLRRGGGPEIDGPLGRANALRSEAERLLGSGEHRRAGRTAREAAALYASVGEPVSAASAMTLAGDALALAGQLEEAAHLYLAVMALQVRAGDRVGLDRSLERAALVDEARGAVDRAGLRRQQRLALLGAG